ncbi:sigma-70 family RNA polymerase sigma factor [Fimbriiglobus ruber]|nr:sigma-70 family RNA polymerase sigma factor [Fimbriiglobus ruber]
MPIRLRSPARLIPTGDDDRALLARFARTGDQTAFATLVQRHGPLVLGVCRRVLRDPHRADDAFQAVFLVLAKRAGAVAAGPSLANWLFGVARRVSLAARRDDRRWTRRQKRGAKEGEKTDQAATPDAATTQPAEWDDLLGSLDDELARLPDALRAAVLECYFREKTQDEAARTLGWSVSTLRRRLDRAKDLLRVRLTARGATFGAALIAGAVAASAATASVVPALVQATATVGVAGRAGGSVAASITRLAKGGTRMSLATKLGLGGLAVGTVALGVSFGAGVWSSDPQAPRNDLPAAVAPQTAVAAAEDPPAVVVKPTPVEKPGVPAKPTEVPRVTTPPVIPAQPPLIPAQPPKGSVQPPALGNEWATITGRVKMTNPPEKRSIAVVADKEHCLSRGAQFYEDLIVNPKNGGVKYVIVWLRPDSVDRKDPFPKDRIHPDLIRATSKNHVIDQPCCQFVPRVLAARVGDTLEIKNSAPVPHNINFSSDDQAFNVTIPPGQFHKLERPLVAQATPIPFKCDIHPWMAGRLRVFEHPYFAVTDDDGKFEIKNAPIGKWRLVVWQENGFHKGRAGILGEPIEVKSGGVEMPPVELELPKP